MEYKRKSLPDIIKIICTVCILFHHYQQLTGTFFYRGLNFYGGRFYFGYLVELFFIMSGWVMVSYIEKIKDKMSFPAFFSKRAIRLLPSKRDSPEQLRADNQLSCQDRSCQALFQAAVRPTYPGFYRLT